MSELIETVGNIILDVIVEEIEVSIPDWAFNYIARGSTKNLTQSMQCQADIWLCEIKREYWHLDCRIAINWDSIDPIEHLEPSFGVALRCFPATIFFHGENDQ